MKGTLDEAVAIIDALSGARPDDRLGSLWMSSPDNDFSVMTLQDAAKAWMDTSAECDWTEDFDGRWESHCGHCWEFFDGGMEGAFSPRSLSFRFCPFCGLEITEVQYPVSITRDTKEDK